MFSRRRTLRPPPGRLRECRFSVEPLERRIALAALAAADTVVVTVASGDTVVESTPRAGGLTLVKRGPGTLVLSSVNAHTGGTVVEEGELVVRNTGSLGSGGLSVQAGARVRLDVGTAAVPATALALDPAARLDVGRGRLAIPSAPEAVATVVQRVRSAASAGWATGAGIGSSAVTTEQWSVGVSAFDGTLTVGWASIGDTDLDGIVDMLDLANFMASGRYGTSQPASWSDGDFNHDHLVGVLDLSLIVAVRAFERGDYRTAPTVSIADVTLTEGTAAVAG